MIRLTTDALKGALLLSAAVHAVPVARAARDLIEARDYVREARDVLHEFLWSQYEVELKPEPPPPPPEPPPPAPEPPPPEPAAPPPPKAPKAEKPPEPPPAAAQAGKVLTAKDDEPLDLTGNTIVQGNADTYAGGVTAAKGTSTAPVYDRNARPNGVVGGRGTTDAPAVDLSRAAAPASKDWNCSHLFPPEADAEDVNNATVSIVVNVRPNGTPESITVLSATPPKLGFERAARSCALMQRYTAAVDRAGQPAGGKTAPFTVRFTR
ncbi:MAG TPA: hypothetical protein VFS43_47980 [Polyangiaceae bacterium]|nr:hypothetical protein [Polyangiaceae bacterium]